MAMGYMQGALPAGFVITEGLSHGQNTLRGVQSGREEVP